jgi:hypothetical protein
VTGTRLAQVIRFSGMGAFSAYSLLAIAWLTR